MPVQLRSLTGQVPYNIEQQVRDLVLSFNALEQRVAALPTTDLRGLVDGLSVEVQDLRARVAALELRVNALENP